MPHSPDWRRPLLIAGLLYAVGIVYGSLIPFELRPVSWDVAWDGFRNIPFLALGAESRADWVANLLLYIPVAFLLMAALWSRRSRALRVVATQMVLVFCFALALTVEFVQQFFAPRTVSLNDLLAEGLGAAIGVMLWWGFGERLLALSREVLQSTPQAFRAALCLYVLALSFLTLFPFDIVVSRAELAERLDAAGRTLFRLGAFETSTLRGIAGIIGQTAAYAGLGGLLALIRPSGAAAKAVALAAGLAVLLAALQLVLWSGTVMIGNVLFAALGALLGVVLVRLVQAIPVRLFRRLARRAALAAILPYLAALAVFNDLVGRPVQPVDRLAAALDTIRFLPFYYHYFTSEMQAMSSVLGRIAMYAPVGGLVWAIRGALPDGRGVKTAGALAAVLAAAMEGARFAVGLRPDPTNILIAGAAGAAAFALLRMGRRWVDRSLAAAPKPRRPQPARPAARPAAAATARPPTPSPRPAPAPAPAPTAAAAAAAAPVAASPTVFRPDWRLLPLLAGCAILLAALADFPMAGWWLAFGLAGYAALLWHRPDWWLAALPAAIGALDLAPWTGRIVFEEFDLLAVTTLAVLFARRPPVLDDLPPLLGRRVLIMALLVVSYLVAIDLPAALAAAAQAGGVQSYFSPVNGLRVAKGLLWAILLMPFLRRAQRDRPEESFRLLAVGMAVGLAATSAWALAERLAFVGPFDFDTVIRVTGSFSSMHVGGGHLGAFLVLALPFLAAPLAVRMPALAWPAALAVLGLAGYVLLATFQRGAYAAFLVGFAVLVFGFAMTPRQGTGPRGRAVAALAAALAISGGLAWLGLSGSVIESRFSGLSHDLATRGDNWQTGLDLRSDDVATHLFGEGLGSFPRRHLWRNPDGLVPTTFSVMREGGEPFLRLGSGENQYFEQRLATPDSGRFDLTLTVRAAAPARIAVLWCRKAQLYSFGCRTALVEPEPGAGWQTLQQSLAPPPQPTTPFARWFGAPATLALHLPDDGSSADIAAVRLTGPDGTDLIANGDFAAGTDRWFFSEDNLQIWRIENQVLMLLFEQGWFGLAILAVALVMAARRLLRGIGRGDRQCAIILASLAGFVALWLTESPLGAPRLGFVFFLLIIWAIGKPRRSAAEMPDRQAAASHAAAARLGQPEFVASVARDS